MLTLSIGIITRNRYHDLIRCVTSIENSIDHCITNGGGLSIGELVISNDGSEITVKDIRYTWKVIEGPKKGIGANRNNIIDNINGEYILITDDDMEFPVDFIKKSLEKLLTVNRNIVLTGRLKDTKGYIIPTEPDFWGYRRIPIDISQQPRGFSDPVTWFPVNCFSKCRFDDSVTYGPTEMDFSYQLRFNGYEITYMPELWAIHWGENRTSVTLNKAHMEFSRIYYTLRRYHSWERSTLNLLLFRILELPRLTVALTRKMGLKGILLAFHAFVKANVQFERGKHSMERELEDTSSHSII
ncbi:MULTISPECIES: glycosyltransferase family 2 protein [Paenibacillus]|uniref:Glycosyltransferase 2-like domain-containing protein n=1 Tax=Paenibacillus lautus TaxID=1401 RepID=A0A1R1B440_PAELA|nr:glycosyltransferase family 2 protein [Paenibacillus lautus]OME93891.1 hypothetical protein BK123_11660 [Paenibacillus lautus]